MGTYLIKPDDCILVNGLDLLRAMVYSRKYKKKYGNLSVLLVNTHVRWLLRIGRTYGFKLALRDYRVNAAKERAVRGMTHRDILHYYQSKLSSNFDGISLCCSIPQYCHHLPRRHDLPWPADS